MNIKKLIKISILGIIAIALIASVTVAIMFFLKAPQNQGADEVVSPTPPSAESLYDQALKASEGGNTAKAKELFDKAKTAYLEDKSDEAAQRLADIESHQQLLKLQAENESMKQSEAPLAESGQ